MADLYPGRKVGSDSGRAGGRVGQEGMRRLAYDRGPAAFRAAYPTLNREGHSAWKHTSSMRTRAACHVGDAAAACLGLRVRQAQAASRCPRGCARRPPRPVSTHTREPLQRRRRRRLSASMPQRMRLNRGAAVAIALLLRRSCAAVALLLHRYCTTTPFRFVRSRSCMCAGNPDPQVLATGRAHAGQASVT